MPSCLDLSRRIVGEPRAALYFCQFVYEAWDVLIIQEDKAPGPLLLFCSMIEGGASIRI